MATTLRLVMLFGRDEETARLADAVENGHRVMTLVGPGGVGKTALAMVVVAHLETRATVGWTATIACAEHTTVASLTDAITGALGFSLEPSSNPVDTLGRALAARGPGLLVLDGLDAMRPAIAGPALTRWLGFAVEVSFLITTRTALRLPLEQVHEVGPLALPGALADAASSPAVRCFVQAASRVRPGYSPAASELPFVVEIVTQLDGHPLALELAAARLAVMGERALLHRLSQSSAVLRASGRGASGAASVDTAIAGSWAALTAQERAVLAACSVFRGGFTLEAVEAVVPGDETLDVLQSLRAQSLVRAVAGAEGGDLRLSLYTIVRAFAAERLTEMATAALAFARHAAFYAAGPLGPSTSRALRAFALAERDNLLVIVERVIALPLVTARVAEPALRALCLLGPLARFGGPTSATLALLAPALRATQGSGADPHLRAEVLALRAETSRRTGQLVLAARDLLEAAAIARAIGEPWLVAKIDNHLAFLGASRGELVLAREHHERAAQVFAQLGRRDGEGDALRGLGAVLARQGDSTGARTCLERAIAAHRLGHDELALAEDHLVLGTLLLDQADPAARAAFEAAAQHAHAAGDRALVAQARGGVGSVAHDAGDLVAANEAYTQAALDLEALGHVMASAVFVGLRGIIARERGQAGEAYAQITAALDTIGEEGERAMVVLLRGHLAALDGPSHPAVVATDASSTTSFHARVALRCAARAPGLDRAVMPLPLPPDALLLGPGATWFRPPHGGRVSLERRRPMALLLDALVTARLATPGRAVSSDELLAAAWPGEKVIATAGAHRVRVAVASLRKLGLREVVQTIEPGYRLTSDVTTIRLG